MKQNTTSQGFTLVELLVVIAIIAILAGILLPTVIGAFKKASEAQARSEVKSIETAVKAYLNEYSKFPEGSGGADVVYGTAKDNKTLMNVLRGIDSTLNPRKIVFIEVSENSLDPNGNFFDPWESQYRVAVDTDFNNEVAAGAPVGIKQGRNVLVWSLGIDADPSKTNTFLTSW